MKETEMIDNHTHDEYGNVVLVEPSPAMEELAATEVVSSAEVEIARINADRDIALAKLAARQADPDLEVQLAAALAELDALRALMAPPEPEPQPEPVVVIDQAADPQPEPEPLEDSLAMPESPVEDSKPKRRDPFQSRYGR